MQHKRSNNWRTWKTKKQHMKSRQHTKKCAIIKFFIIKMYEKIVWKYKIRRFFCTIGRHACVNAYKLKRAGLCTHARVCVYTCRLASSHGRHCCFCCLLSWYFYLSSSGCCRLSFSSINDIKNEYNKMQKCHNIFSIVRLEMPLIIPTIFSIMPI